MKKKLVCLILVLAFTLSVLTGCILPVNTERDMMQVIATVTHGGNVAKLTKLEVVEQYYSYGATYVQNYGMTTREAFDYILEQLANRKLLVLDAIQDDVGGSDLDIKWNNAGFGSVDASTLSQADRNKAQDAVNTQLEEVFKQYVKTVTEEMNADVEEEEEEGEEEEEEDTDDRTVRPLPTLEEEEEEKDYSEGVIESWYQNFNYATDWEDYECESKEVARRAFNRLKKLLEDQYKNEETFLQSQYEQIIIEKLQDKLLESVTVTDAEVLARYNFNLKKNEETFKADDASYASAFSNNEVLYYHPESGYATVKHVLLAFDEAALEDRAVENTHMWFADGVDYKTFTTVLQGSGNYTEDVINNYRRQLVDAIKVNNYGDFANWWKDGEGYDKEEMKDLIDWRDLVYNKDAVSTVNFTQLFDIIRSDVLSKTTDKEKLDKFTDYIFGYSNASDSGMFNNAYDYTVKAEENTYMEEFTNICQYLISGKELPDTLNYGVYGDETGKVGSMGWCITDYGVHLVMISHIANAKTNAEGYYIVDNAGALKEILIGDTEQTTLFDYIHEALKSAKETDTISKYQKNIIDVEGKDSLWVNNSIVNEMFAG